MESGIDLREEFDKLMVDWGNDVIYVRKMTGLHCKCWNPKEQTGNPRCKLCFGTGLSVKTEIHKIRSKTNTMPISTSSLLQYQEQGNIMEPSYVFYMRYDSNPASGDIIIDLTWADSIPNQIIRAYEISFPEPERGKEGRTEYYKVACRTLSTELATLYEAIKRRNLRR